jgi:hypothetical protein
MMMRRSKPRRGRWPESSALYRSPWIASRRPKEIVSGHYLFQPTIHNRSQDGSKDATIAGAAFLTLMIRERHAQHLQQIVGGLGGVRLRANDLLDVCDAGSAAGGGRGLGPGPLKGPALTQRWPSMRSRRFPGGSTASRSKGFTARPLDLPRPTAPGADAVPEA